MSLPLWIVPFKEPKTEIRLINGVYYKYAVDYKYNAAKKRTDKITKGLLGKITEKEGFTPSDKYLLKMGSGGLPRVDIKTYGLYYLFNSLLADDLASLLTLFDPGVSEILLTVAMMRFGHQSPLKRIPTFHAHDYCSQDWVKKGLDDKKITAALKFTGENRNLLVDWMRTRMGISSEFTTNFVMIDSTHIPSLSEHMHVNVPGYNPAHSYDPQIRLMYIFSASLKQPVYYRLVNGNITDVSSMKKCVLELGVEHIVFIADKGFYSKQNTLSLSENGLHYIIPLYRNNGLIDWRPLQEANSKQKINNYFSYQQRIIWYYQYEREGQKITTFLDDRLRVEEETDYLLRIDTHPEKYTKSQYFEKSQQFGTLSLISHLPEHTSPQVIYETYKQRNEIEVMFDAYKNFLKADKTYMQDRYVLEGWLMANFIAMIAYYRLYSLLKEAKLLSNHSPKDLVELSKTIYQTKVAGQWTSSEITKKTAQLFKKIKIDYLN
jgi:transposase